MKGVLLLIVTSQCFQMLLCKLPFLATCPACYRCPHRSIRVAIAVQAFSFWLLCWVARNSLFFVHSKTASVVTFAICALWERSTLNNTSRHWVQSTVSYFWGWSVNKIVLLVYLEPSTCGGISAFRLGKQQYGHPARKLSVFQTRNLESPKW